MTVQPDEPSYSRDEELEEARVGGRPAEADLNADPKAAGINPITVSPDPDAKN